LSYRSQDIGDCQLLIADLIRFQRDANWQLAIGNRQ